MLQKFSITVLLLCCLYKPKNDTEAIVIEKGVSKENDVFRSESSPRQLAFQQLAAEIQQDIVENAESAAAINISDPKSRYVIQLESEGINAPNYHVGHLKVRLQQSIHSKNRFIRRSVREQELLFLPN